MVAQLESVDTDAILAALAALGHPTELDGPEAAPGADAAQLLGVLTVITERLAVTHQVAGTPGRRQAFVDGYLRTLHAQTPCGTRQALDLVLLRLKATSDLLDGYSGGFGPLVRACVDAAASFAAVASISRDGIPINGGNDKAEQMRGHLVDGHGALTAARMLLIEISSAARRGRQP